MKIRTAWTVLVPGTKEPISKLTEYGRAYILFCDPDAKDQAERAAKVYPENHRFVVKVKIQEVKKKL